MPPRLVTGQVLQQVHTHIFVLRTNQPQPQQKGAEGERRVIPDGVFRNCVYFWLIPCAEIAMAE